MLYKACVEGFRVKNPQHRLPENLCWYACGAHGRSVGVRSRDCQVVYPIFLPMVLRCARKSSATNL